MTPALRPLAETAITRLDRAVDAGGDLTHAEIHAAALSVIELRDAALGEHRAGHLPRARLDAINAVVSLAYGAEFPLSGVHLRRAGEARERLRAMLDAS